MEQMTNVLLGVLIALTAKPGSLTQALPPDRGELVSVVLQWRQRLFAQRVVVDGCSLARPESDTVSKSNREIVGRFKDDVFLGTAKEKCYMSTYPVTDSIPGFFLETIEMEDQGGRGSGSPDRSPPRVVVRVQVVNPGGFGHREAWYIGRTSNGYTNVVGMRVYGMSMAD